MDAQKLKLAITKALAYTENGGKPSLKNIKAGQSGELKSIFQFLPETWKRQSKEVTGKDNLPATPENEALVAHGVISPIVDKGFKEGKSTDEIASEVGSFWNSGRTDGANKGLIGTNKSGVKYDVPAYAKKVVNYTNEFLKETETPPAPAESDKPEIASAKVQDFVDHIKAVNPQAIAPTANPIGDVATAPQLQNAQPSAGLSKGMLS